MAAWCTAWRLRGRVVRAQMRWCAGRRRRQMLRSSRSSQSSKRRRFKVAGLTYACFRLLDNESLKSLK